MGDSVRIAMTRRLFKKGYTGQWSEGLFVVSEKLRTIPTTYRLKDLDDEQIDGTFYHQELQLVRVEQDKVYTVERVRPLYFVCTMILSQPLERAMDHF